MTSHVGRLYALAVALLVLFLIWTAVAAQPWAAPAPQDARLAALAAREQRVQIQSIAVRRIVQQRWAVYRKQLRTRSREIAAAKHAQALAAQAPSVRIVTLPPLTVTRTS